MGNFSEKLVKRLEELEMKPYRLAKLSGLNIQHCYKIVSGDRVPSDETLLKIASVPDLCVTMDQLKGWRDLCRCADMKALVTELPDELLIEEFLRRYPEKELRNQKLNEYVNSMTPAETLP